MLAATDPYEDAAPNKTTSWAGPHLIDGHEYDEQYGGTGFNMFALNYIVADNGTKWPAALVYGPDDPPYEGTHCGMTNFYYRHGASAPVGNPILHIENPLNYERQTPAHIILGVTHWHCGIHEGRIDTDSFDDTHYDYFVDEFVPDMLCSVPFISESTITIIKRLLEQSGRSYLYINKLSQLAMNYLPGMVTAYDWEITESDIIRWKRHEKIMDRTIPGTIKYGWTGRHMNTAEPGCSVWTKDYAPAVEHPRLDKEYQALYVGYDQDDYGEYERMNDYRIVEVEVGAIGFAFEIGDEIKAHNPIWGLNEDDAYEDILTILDITLMPNTNTVNLIMVKHKDWGTPP